MVLALGPRKFSLRHCDGAIVEKVQIVILLFFL